MNPVPQDAKEIFLQAIEEKSSDAQAAFLAQACGDDPALRARVEALLAAHQADSFLERPAAPLGATLDQVSSGDAPEATSRPPRSGAETPGAHVGSYKLLQLIGEGGMGAVWMAEQQRPVRRQVALKVIKAGMDSAQVVARFEAERQALALMDHPNIAKVFDGGTTDNGRPFFVMELVRGIPITKYCDDLRLAPRQRLELFVQVCQALQHAHQKGITHRDIKPSNVMVAPYDGRPVVKVIDFGVAKAAGQQLTERTMFTEFGAVVGTLEYMSPEQSELNNHDIDTRSDIYSLGVLLYELLTGTPPLTRQRLQQAAFSEMLRLIREEDPPKPSTRLSDAKQTLPSLAALRQTDPAKLPKLLRGELDCIVMKALEKDRGRRYETANALARDIQRYLCDEPVEAQPPTPAYRMKKFVRRHKGPVLAAAIVGLAVVVGMAGTAWGLVRASRALALEAEARASAEQERDAKERARAAATHETAQKEIARAAAEQEKNAKQQALTAAEDHRRAAERARQEAERALYFNRVSLAYQYWVADNLPQSRRMLDACPTEQRAWEWRYLDRLHHGGLFTLPGNGQFTTSLQVSSDGKRLAAFANAGDAGVRLWDLTAHQPLANIRRLQEQRGFSAFALSGDGDTIALGEESGAVTLWEAATGKFIRELARLPRSISSLSFSCDGKWLAAARADARNGERLLPFTEPPRNEDFVVWNAATGEEVFHPKGYGFSVLFSPDGSRLLTFKLNSAIRLSPSFPETSVALFDTTNWSEVAVGKLGTARGFSFSGDSQRLALGTWDRQQDVHSVTIINPATGEELSSLKLDKRVGDIALSRNGTLLATAELMGSPGIDIWDLKTRRRVRTLRGHPGWINAITFTPDGRLASCSWDDTIKFWDPSAGSQLSQLVPASVAQAEKAVFSLGAGRLAFSQPNSAMLFVGAVRIVTVLDLAQSGKSHALAGHQGGTIAIAFNRDGTRLTTGGRQGDAKVWDLDRWSEVCTYRGHDGEICALAISPDGRLAASVHEPKENTQARFGRGTFKAIPSDVHVWDAATGAERFKLVGHSGGIHRLTFSPDGKSLVSAGGRVVKFWNIETGSLLRELDEKELTTWAIDTLLFAPSGKTLVTGGEGIVQLWDVAAGRPVTKLEGHGSRRLDGLAFSPDETRVATASFREVKLWDARTGQEILTLPLSDLPEVESPPVIALSWTSDGHSLRAGLRDGSVVEWREE